MSETAWVASVEWDEPKLARIEITKRMDKSVARAKDIAVEMGSYYYLPDRILLTAHQVFDERDKAIQWLRDTMRAAIKRQKEKVHKMESALGQIK